MIKLLMKTKKRKFIVAFLSFLFFFLIIYADENNKNNHNYKNRIVITAVGDIMMGTLYPKKILPPNDGKNIFDNINKYLSGDIVLGNLEGTFTSVKKSWKKANNVNIFAFKMPFHYIKYLKNAGFNVLNIANNHSYDFGKKGFFDTYNHLRKNGFLVAGLKGKAAIIKIKNLNIGILGFSWHYYTNNILDLKSSAKLIKKIKSEVDFLIVTFHGGAEGEKANHVKNKMEYFYGNKRGNVYKFAHIAIDNGADLIIGHGPHVLRAIEIYKGKLIAYSLGNFLTYGIFSMKWPRNISVILKIEYSLDKKLESVKIIPVVLRNRGIPFYDKKKNAIKILNYLIKSDFPESDLYFDNNGILKFPDK